MRADFEQTIAADFAGMPISGNDYLDCRPVSSMGPGSAVSPADQLSAR